jgi:hypothetical protein
MSSAAPGRRRSAPSRSGPDDETYDALVDAAKLRQKISWVLGGVAAVGAGVSVYLWVRATRTPAPIEIAPTEGGAAAHCTINSVSA